MSIRSKKGNWQCETCAFAEHEIASSYKTAHQVECRIRPPVVSVHAKWPIVWKNGWCGEYQEDDAT